MGNICSSNMPECNTIHTIQDGGDTAYRANYSWKAPKRTNNERTNKETKAVPLEELKSLKTTRKRRKRRPKKALKRNFSPIEDNDGSSCSVASSSSSENQWGDDHGGIKFISKGSITIIISPDKEQQVQENKSKTKKGVFQDFISEQYRKQVHLNASIMRIDFPRGNFIDTRDARLVQVSDAKRFVEAADSVCHIYFHTTSSQLGTATGFRVGGERPYIMTANHVLKYILEFRYQHLGLESQNRLAALSQENVYVVFEHFTDKQPGDVKKFFLKPTVHFSDDCLDVAILELDDCSDTLSSSAFQLYPYSVLPSFTLLGHSEGKPMTMDAVDKIINIYSAQTKSDIEIVKEQSKQHMQSFNHQDMDYECPPHNVLTNPNRHLFHCKCSKGASGSPGVVALEDGRVVVVTMLLCGYPDWYYNERVGQSLKNTWPQEFCVEQGVNVASLHETLLANAPQLCQEIFIDTFPTPNLLNDCSTRGN